MLKKSSGSWSPKNPVSLFMVPVVKLAGQDGKSWISLKVPAWFSGLIAHLMKATAASGSFAVLGTQRNDPPLLPGLTG